METAPQRMIVPSSVARVAGFRLFPGVVPKGGVEPPCSLRSAGF